MYDQGMLDDATFSATTGQGIEEARAQKAELEAKRAELQTTLDGINTQISSTASALS